MNNMHKFVWVLQILLALFFLMPGVTKLITPEPELIQKGMLAAGQSALPIRAIGALELLGSAGMILPILLGILPVLTPLAAIGFCLVMAGAGVVHGSKGEYNMLPLLGVVFMATAYVAWYRFTHKPLPS